VHMTVSAGVVAWAPGETLDDMLRRADAALYQAKDGGRDCVVIG
jgi:PleD family two-component response regulator